MPKTNFQYDETGSTASYVFLTFLGFILLPSTWYFLSTSSSHDETIDPEKKKKHLISQAKGTSYYQACDQKAARLSKTNPWVKTRRRIAAGLLLVGWCLFASVIYQVSQFDYEMANFDPYEILGVDYNTPAKEIKKKYREMSLKYHPDKPTGNEKLFMKLTKAYDALTDETAKYNWEHYGNPDGPQAMQFGIGLPAWIVEEKNSIWVLGLYALVFMIGLPSAVYYWWSNSIKFSGEQVLLDTTQLYYYFFHKTPHMMLRRVLMVLAASLEFERGHNSEVVERPTDNGEIPHLMKSLSNLGVNNKEKPLCFSYSVKARALLHAHLSRIALPEKTLHEDRLYIIKKCPFLIQEMVTCTSQLILLAHAGRIGRLPSLDTIEFAMKLSPLIVQALWDKQSPLLQLPHIEEDMLKHFHTKRRNIKSLQQVAKLKDEERRSLLRKLTDEEYKDIIRVLASFPILDVTITTEVVDDEEQHVVTAGAIVTVTLLLERRTMESIMNLPMDMDNEDGDDLDNEDVDSDMVELTHEDNLEAATKDGELSANKENDEADKEKKPLWRKPQKKKGGKKGGGGGQKQKAKNKKKDNKNLDDPAATSGDTAQSSNSTVISKASDDATLIQNSNSHATSSLNRHKGHKTASSGRKGQQQQEGSSDEGAESSGSEEDSEDQLNKAQSNVDEEDDEAEWERFQKKLNKREKALEGKSKVSHSVHSPYFTDDKQEFWWCYISDRKNHALVTPPIHVTGLVEREEVELKFTAPAKPGHYSFTVAVKSDSYLGVDVSQDIKLDVHEAREVSNEHPQWEFEDEDEDENSKAEESDDEFATDDDFDDEDVDDE